MSQVKGLDFKIARLRAGYRQYEVAAKLAIHPSQLSEIESGRRQPSDKLLKQLLQILEQGKSREARDEG